MTLRSVVYTDTGVTVHEDLVEAKDASGTTWVRVTDPTDEELKRVAGTFGIHDLELEDVRRDVRPKTEVLEDHTFVFLKTARLRGGETTFAEELKAVSIGLFVGNDWVVSLAGEEVSAVETVWNRVQGEEPRTLSRGPDFATYRIVDAVVDEYFTVLDEIEDDIEAIEDEVTDPTDGTLERISTVRRDLLSIRRLLWPTREAVGVLARGDPPQVADDTERYFRDVYDHLVQLVEIVETYRDLLSGARDLYLNSLSMSTNEVMKKLTVVATVVLPLTFVAGVYGMNFEGGPYNMPELGWRFGYPAVMLGMAAVAVVLLSYFRREGWL